MDASGGGLRTAVRVVMEPALRLIQATRQWSEQSERLHLPRRPGERRRDRIQVLRAALKRKPARCSSKIARGRRVPDKTDRTSVELFATRTTSGTSGSLRRDVARSVMPARQEPRVDFLPYDLKVSRNSTGPR